MNSASIVMKDISLFKANVIEKILNVLIILLMEVANFVLTNMKFLKEYVSKKIKIVRITAKKEDAENAKMDIIYQQIKYACPRSLDVSIKDINAHIAIIHLNMIQLKKHASSKVVLSQLILDVCSVNILSNMIMEYVKFHHAHWKKITVAADVKMVII